MKSFIYLLILGLLLYGVYKSASKKLRKKIEKRNKQYERTIKQYKDQIEAWDEDKAKTEAEARTRAYIKSADRLPGRFHINFEGKIYPCNAKVFRCPYGEDVHSTSKLELYNILMDNYGVNANPSKNAMNELRTYNKLTSLKSLSPLIEEVDYPVDMIVSTLKEAISHIKNVDFDYMDSLQDHWNAVGEELAEIVYDALNHGHDFTMPDFIPQEILRKGEVLLAKRQRGMPEDYSGASRNSFGLRTITTLKTNYSKFKKYEQYQRKYEEDQKWGLTRANYQVTHDWMTKEFMKFSHDLNTSKMITQPIFYGDLEQAKETIRNMDNYELLSTFDDYSITDQEIERNVKEANYFKYEDRKDLSIFANFRMSTWYERNREIYKNWKINTPKRVLLSMEVAKELDRRTIIRQDSAVGKMFTEGKSI